MHEDVEKWWGTDSSESVRPGVPKEKPPAPIPGAEVPIERQAGVPAVLGKPTPVFGTTVPPRGVSGLLKRLAYRLPEHHPQKWMLLLVSDRVDALEARLARHKPELAAAAAAAVALFLWDRRREILLAWV